MEKYIPKSALVAEIEKRKSELQSRIVELGTFESNTLGLFQEMDLYDDIISFLDTLEVKENDLVEELDYDDYMTFFKEHPEYNNGDWGFEETWTFGQYCYKLGLKAQQGE